MEISNRRINLTHPQRYKHIPQKNREELPPLPPEGKIIF